jgi:hypothetical protein
MAFSTIDACEKSVARRTSRAKKIVKKKTKKKLTRDKERYVVAF